MCSSCHRSKSGVYPRVSVPRQIRCFRLPATMNSGAVVYIQETNNTSTRKSSLGTEISTATAMEHLRRPVLAIPVQVDEERAAVLVDTLIKTCETSDCCVAFAGSTSYPQDLCGRAHEAESVQDSNTGAVTAGAINAVACLLDAVALSDRPRLRLIPLLTCAGWTPDLVASLPVTHVLVPQNTAPPSSPAQGGEEAPTPANSATKGPDRHNRPKRQQPQQQPADSPPVSDQQGVSRTLDEKPGASSSQCPASFHPHRQPPELVDPCDQQRQQQSSPHEGGGGVSEDRSGPGAPSWVASEEAVRREAANSNSYSGPGAAAGLPSQLVAAAEALVGDLERRRPGHLPRWVRVPMPVGGAAASSGPGAAEVEVEGDGGDGGGQEGGLRGAASGVVRQGHTSLQLQQMADLRDKDSDQGRRGSCLHEQQQPPSAAAAPSAGGPSSSGTDGCGAQPHMTSAETSGTSSRGGCGRRDGGADGGAPPGSQELQPQPQQPQQHYITRLDGEPLAPGRRLHFRRVAVGGTFDRLHAGHELLLAATALVADGFVFVGVTADALLANKSYKELLQPYNKRVEEAVAYMRAVRPGLQVEAGPLSDPKAPTIAELDPSMDALVVSVETLPGAAAINAGRVARGFAPLAVVTVPVIGVPPAAMGAEGAGSGGAVGRAAAAVGGKLSSSGLRALEAATKRAKGAEGREAKSE